MVQETQVALQAGRAVANDSDANFPAELGLATTVFVLSAETIQEQWDFCDVSGILLLGAGLQFLPRKKIVMNPGDIDARLAETPVFQIIECRPSIMLSSSESRPRVPIRRRTAITGIVDCGLAEVQHPRMGQLRYRNWTDCCAGFRQVIRLQVKPDQQSVTVLTTHSERQPAFNSFSRCGFR